jgi:hypothetical protein
MKLTRARTVAAAMGLAGALFLFAVPGWTAPTCPLSYGGTMTARSHKLFLYFPAVDDPSFPDFINGASPARAFDITDLDPSVGTTAALTDRIHEIVVDDYCEFNVEVLATTTNPETLNPPPALRATVAVGSDPDFLHELWGQAQETDTGDHVNPDFARVWAGTYKQICEGGDGNPMGCSPPGALKGGNSTLERWAQAIGGSAAHEGGHTYGLAHSDDDPPTGNCGELGAQPTAGEDAYNKHLMPTGCNLTGEDRASFRRHFSNRDFGLLATNVGLTIQTMHNWDMVNPNSTAAQSLTMDFLSAESTLTISWSWAGVTSPWIDPTVAKIAGTVLYQNKPLNHFRITWSKANPAWAGPPGVLPAGAPFHVGTTFTGVDFNQPDAIVVQNIRLFDAKSKVLPLHPRLPTYDSGTEDAADGSFGMHFYPALEGGAMTLQSAIVYQLPRVASIESMVGAGSPATFDGLPIVPWSAARCVPTGDGTTVRCGLGNLSDRPHVQVTHTVTEPGVYDCSQGVPQGVKGPRDSTDVPDVEGPLCAGSSRDPFPSTTVYVIATFVDPNAEHWDPKAQKIVTGPVTSKVFYQFAGIRDLAKLGKPKG